MNPLHELHAAGQSLWLDFITRRILSNGQLKNLIEQDGITGVTSNPTIFQKAITGSADYDSPIRALAQQGKPAAALFEALAIEDIQQACDLFRPVYEKTRREDGYVSLEVNPHLARKTPETLAEARHLFRAVNRPNVMIKIPGTREGLPAIEQALGEGININITLIFSLERYQEVLDAWLAGLGRLEKAGKSLASVASVASFFISRVDTLIDPQLDKGGHPELCGQAAIANAKMAYQLFQKITAGSRFQAFASKGARVQRPLWASTSTKNPKYRDVLYVEELIGTHTVNTLPPQTVDAFRDHGKVRQSLVENPAAAAHVLQRLSQAGVSMEAATRELEEDGLKLFADSYDSLLQSIERKKDILNVSA